MVNFSHQRVVNMIKGLVRCSTHEPQQAIPIKICTIKRACHWLCGLSTEGEIVAGTILFGLVTFLRQCPFLSTRTGTMHPIPRSDDQLLSDKAIIMVCSSKTTSAAGGTNIQILREHGDLCCPVHPLMQAFPLVPASQNSPLFLLPPEREILSDTKAVSLFRITLGVTGFKNYNMASLHSFHCSGPYACAGAGVPTVITWWLEK